jgi:hypothetical protein
MAVAGLPPWLPDWEGAETATHATDIEAVRRCAQGLVDLVFTDDTVYLDSLPDELESALVSPLGILSDVLEGGSDVELLVASRLLRRSIGSYLADAPQELRQLLHSLPDPV